MKIARLMALGLLLSAGMTTFSGCSDDEEGSRVLLRPVTTMVTDMNHVQLSWKAVPGATEYVVEIYRVTDGVNELYDTITTGETSLTLDLEWDDSYQIKVRGIGNGRESAVWSTDVITLVFPTILGQTKAIDTQARVTWTPTDEFSITTLTAMPLDEKGNEAGEAKTYEVTPEEYAAGEKILTGLAPSTSYKVSAYSGEAVLDNYRGRVMLATVTADDFSHYGNIIDLRDKPYDENYFNTVDWAGLPDGTLFILPEGKTYTVNSGTTVAELSRSVSFTTPQTLGDYATFRFDNAFRMAANAQVGKISFKRMTLKAKKTLDEVTDTGLSGKQVFCPEQDNFTLDSITFDDCHIENFRSIIRSKFGNGNIEAVVFEGCTINAIGNQGIISTDGKKTNHITSMKMDECTVTNICGIADLRDSGSGKEVRITNTTFCYAPMESSFLFRTNAEVAVSIENCVFGASMKEDNKKPLFNQIGTGGTGDYSGTLNVTYANTYATSDLNLKKNPLGWTAAPFSTPSLFQDPAAHNFKLNSSFTACQTAGAGKWRVM